MNLSTVNLFSLLFLYLVVANDNPFYGNWVMCKKSHGNITTVANICTKFQFTKEGKGKIVFPGQVSAFLYKIQDSEILFSFESETDRSNFISKETVLHFECFKGKSELVTLTEKYNKQIFYLVKEN